MNTQEKIDSALTMFQDLEEADKKNTVLHDVELSNASHTVVNFLVNLANKTTKNDSNATKFKKGVNILLQLLKRYNQAIKELANYERKAVYYQMKYEGVIEQEAVNDSIMQNVQRLLDERDELKQKLSKYEN